MRDRWYIRLLIAAALASFAGRAQNPADQSSTFDLKGTVCDSVTKAPIAHALVRIQGQSSPDAFTDGNGSFEIPHVRPGLAYLQAEKPGYFSPQAVFEGRGAVGVMLSEATGDVQLKLIPEAHIEGRIVNSDDEPVAGVIVSALGERIVGGWKRQMQLGSATTNAAGRFRIDGLQPGQYYVHTQARQMFLSAPPDSGVNIGYAPQYYPAAPDATWSQAMELRAGETMQANMALTPGRFYQVNGTVIGLTGQGAFVELTNEFGQISGSGIDPKTGTFKIQMVFPGDWKLISRSSRQFQMAAAYGEQSVRVSNADVNGVRIDMHPASDIPLDVQMSSSAMPPPNDIGTPMIQLIATGRGARQLMFFAQPDGSGKEHSYRFTGVIPGSYDVLVPPLPGVCVQSISAGNRDLTSGELTVEPDIAPQPIHVVLGTDCAKLTGSVSSNDGDPAGMVVLMPVSAPASPMLLNMMPDRSFARQTLSPGDYRIFAVSDIAGLEYANPEAVLNIPSEEIHLDANQTTHVSLELYRREQP